MSNNYASSNKTQTSSTITSTTSTSSISDKYSTTVKTRNISSSSGTYTTVVKTTSILNSGVKINYNDKNTSNASAMDANNVRPSINKITTGATPKSTLTSNYTSAYPPNRRLNNSFGITYTRTSINRPPIYPSTSMKNENKSEGVLSSNMPNLLAKSSGPNPKSGLFSFDAKLSNPKQSLTVQSKIAASSVKQPFSSNISSSNRKRGYALILNHYKYKNDCSPREGTHHDVDKLKDVFDYYNIETNVKTDLKLSQIKTEVNKLKKKDFTNYECFIMVIMTHGERNNILYANDEEYDFIKVIEDPLLIGHQSLSNKPKIFVIQACRGSTIMPVLEMDNVHNPVHKQNIFKCNATYEGCVAFRMSEHGSIFIQSFCRMLKDIGRYATIYEVMTKVIDEVSSNVTIPQVPIVASSMIASFCFGSLLK